jgi:hypothetical protein
MDEDEEALIDRLASLAAVVGPDALSKQILSNPYEMPPMGNYYRELNEEMLAREALASLPRQFAYRPDDPRYYLTAEQFPNYYPEEKAENTYRQEKAMGEVDSRRNSGSADFQQNIVPHHKSVLDSQSSSRSAILPKVNPESQQKQDVNLQTHGDDNGPVHFMKKNQPANELGHAAQHFVAEPSNFMTSDHSVNKPPVNIRPVDNDQSFSYSDIYYIGEKVFA